MGGFQIFWDRIILDIFFKVLPPFIIGAFVLSYIIQIKFSRIPKFILFYISFLLAILLYDLYLFIVRGHLDFLSDILLYFLLGLIASLVMYLIYRIWRIKKPFNYFILISCLILFAFFYPKSSFKLIDKNEPVHVCNCFGLGEVRNGINYNDCYGIEYQCRDIDYDEYYEAVGLY